MNNYLIFAKRADTEHGSNCWYHTENVYYNENNWVTEREGFSFLQEIHKIKILCEFVQSEAISAFHNIKFIGKFGLLEAMESCTTYAPRI